MPEPEAEAEETVVPDAEEPVEEDIPEQVEAAEIEVEAREAPTAGGADRGMGLSALDEPEPEPTTESTVSDDDRVADLLQRSRKTSRDVEKEGGDEQPTAPAPNAVGTDLFTVRRDSAPTNVFRRTGGSRPPPGRRRRPIPQPAVRQKRLDRSRHVEYKYEVRGLMQEIGVADEHRSSLLGSIWAKGERQDVEEAKAFIRTQVDLGNITEEMATSLLDVVHRYTVRR